MCYYVKGNSKLHMLYMRDFNYLLSESESEYYSATLKDEYYAEALKLVGLN